MKRRLIIGWIARLSLLFLSFIGLASLISNATNPLVNLNKEEVEIAWVFGIGGLGLFILSFIRRSKTGGVK